LQATLKNVWEAYNKSKAPKQEQSQPQKVKEQEQTKDTKTEAQAEPQEPKQEPINTEQQNISVEAEPNTEQEQQPTFFEPNYKRIRINEKEEYTYKLILELEAKEQGRKYLTSDITALSKRSQCIEARYLKTLWEQGKLNREWKDRQYYYTLATTNSKTVSQNPMSNPKTLDE
jgi:hypothetical protein